MMRWGIDGKMREVGSGKGAQMKLAKMTIFASVACVLAAGCDDGSTGDADGGEWDSLSGDYGVCVAEPTGCHDILNSDGDLLVHCCYGDTRYSCQNDSLFYSTDCTAGCSYDLVSDAITCAQTSGPWGGPPDDHGQDFPDPPTDPGPGF